MISFDVKRTKLLLSSREEFSSLLIAQLLNKGQAAGVFLSEKSFHFRFKQATWLLTKYAASLTRLFEAQFMIILRG